ncbi:hypothetical protein BDR04DRAFT_1111724 [Suillus decipiens]|nr:hypothetical protein BDR04DRAFT_1111826 [Suillus decipiens]KAG2063255.1 hypothetical protein BDR04DRAFT_1111724 [Suillus decipiens]
MSSPTLDLIPQFDIGRTFGALFIGVIISAVLFGLSNVQAFIYFQTHGNAERIFYKLAVIWLWIFDALHMASTVHCIYYYLVINYTNFDALIGLVWSFKLSIAIGFVLIYSVHLLYIYRIWIISKGKSRILSIAVGIVIILRSGVGAVFIWALYQCHVFSDVSKFDWATYMDLAMITLSDISIASTLCYLLATSRTGFSSTDSLITKLMAYIINTGCLTSVCSIAIIIACAVMPNNLVYITIDFLMVKVYVNSFLALLNARHYANTNPNSFHNCHGVYRPELCIQMSEDEEFRASQRDMFKHPDEAVDPSRSVKQPNAVTPETTEMNSFSV